MVRHFVSFNRPLYQSVPFESVDLLPNGSTTPMLLTSEVVLAARAVLSDRPENLAAFPYEVGRGGNLLTAVSM